MATRILELDLSAGPPRSGVASPERMSAVLRWRARWLRRSLPYKSGLSLRLLPALLEASFPYRDLRGEPPGIEGLGARRCWGVVARAFDLPPPISRQRGRRLVSALLTTQAPEGLQTYALATHGAGPQELERLHARLTVCQDILSNAGVPMKVAVLPSTSADFAAEPLLRALPFGALIAGRIPAQLWENREGLSSGEVGCAAIARLAVHAPTPFCEIALLLMAGETAPSPAAALRSALEQGFRPAELADPELFCAAWGTAAAVREALLYRLLASCTSNPRTRQVAAQWARPLTKGFGGLALGGPASTGEILELGRLVTRAAVSAVRRAPAPGRIELKKRLRRDVIEAGLPKVLVPSFAQALRTVEAGRGRAPLLQLVPRPGPSFEVRDPSQAPLGRGRKAEQAHARAVALVARVTGRIPPDVADDRVWRLVGNRFLHPAEERSLFLVLLPDPTAKGSPHDPLNRGPERRFGFGDCVAVLLRPGGRPSARRLTPDAAVAIAVREAWRGISVEVHGASGEVHPAAARLSRALHLARPGELMGAPPTLEAGGRVLYLTESRLRQFKLGRFAARPRLCYPDPEAPDLSPWAEDNLRVSNLGHRATILCHATRFGEENAGILYVDPLGFQLREEVPLVFLAEHLADAQALVRQEPSPMLLSVRYSKELELAAGRYGPAPTDGRVDVEISGSLPFGLQLQLQGERFGRGHPLGWRAAAQTVLAAWPSGAIGRIAVKSVRVEIACKPVSGLARLYARSLALRRLQAHVRLSFGP
jgi:hypothetical protein